MIRRQIIPGMVATGLILSLPACTNPYDPVQRFVGGGLIGAGSGAAIGLPLPVVTVPPSAPRSEELWARSPALSQRHPRPLITATTITGITATTVTDTTRVTTGEDVIVLTADRLEGPPRQTHPGVQGGALPAALGPSDGGGI
jgi:hypothetical protein